MPISTEQYLSLINQRGKDRKPLSRVYGNMLKHRELFINAYGKLYKNKGAMTAGVDGETVDGMSLEKIDSLIETLKTRTYRWKPAKRVAISKGKGRKGKRPLGLPTWMNKVVQEVIRVILEAYYEPQFKDTSHGFRPGKGCHTALKEVGYWAGTKWFIEADIKSCFDNINHEILLNILAKRIKDQSFLNLIRSLLKAGYLLDMTYYKTYSGTPQGGVVSPLLANIYLHELDNWIEQQLLPKYNYGKRRKKSPAYIYLDNRERSSRKAGNNEEAKRCRKLKVKTPRSDPMDPNFRRLKYVRYADDFLLGFIGPKSEAEEIKSLLNKFLAENLKLTLSEEKTLITHASKDKAKFLGYEIFVANPLDRPQIRGKMYFKIPNEVRVNWTRKYSERGKPASLGRRTQLEVYEIIDQYQAEFRGLYQYYKYALNASGILHHIRYVMLQSLVKTLADKLKIKTRQVYRRYKRGPGIGVTIEGRDFTFGTEPIRRQKFWQTINDTKIEWVYYGRNELIQRMEAGQCEIPNCPYQACGNIEGHHIRKLKDLTNKYKKKGQTAPQWVTEMIGRKRKSLMVCETHHRLIHSGKYDGPNLRKLTDRRAG